MEIYAVAVSCACIGYAWGLFVRITPNMLGPVGRAPRIGRHAK